MAPVTSASNINVHWLIKLRWLAVLGQLVAVTAVRLLLDEPLPWAALGALIATAAASNIVLTARVRSRGEAGIHAGVLTAVIVLDVLLLTGMLALSGGRDNPFALFYIVHVVLAAVLLPPRAAWATTALCVLGYATIFVWYTPHPLLHMGDHQGHGAAHTHGWHLHLQGMLIALALTSVLIVYFVTRLTSDREGLELSLRVAREREGLARHAHALASFAASAAHEMASPLTAIAITAREIERSAEQGGDDDVIEDARTVREQVEACREILSRISYDAGMQLGEEPDSCTLQEAIESSLTPWKDRHRADLLLASDVVDAPLHLPKRAFGECLRSLLRNAVAASPQDAPVQISAHWADAWVCIEVRDRGHGMPPDILRRADEPFFTTRGPAQGMGLGLYLARTLIQDIGGHFEIHSEQGAGTTVRLLIPPAPTDNHGRNPTY